MRYVARGVDNLNFLWSGTSSASSSNSTSTPSPTPDSTVGANDAEFKPWLVVVGIVLIAAIWFIFWGKRKLERRMMVQPVDSIDGNSDDEPDPPSFFDVHIHLTLGGRRSWSWRDIQPLSLAQSRRRGPSWSDIRANLPCIYPVFEKHRDATIDQLPDLTSNQKDELLCVSTIIAMPLESRIFHSNGEIAEVGRAENAGASRESGTSDAVGRDKLDLMVGVALVPLTYGEK